MVSDRITFDPQIMAGRACIRGMRITVSLVQDCLKTDCLPLTQEFIANMLGTNRAGVTLAAQKLQRQNLINYSRGSITVTDRKHLEANSCECYQVMGKESQRLFTSINKPEWQRF